MRGEPLWERFQPHERSTHFLWKAHEAFCMTGPPSPDQRGRRLHASAPIDSCADRPVPCLTAPAHAQQDASGNPAPEPSIPATHPSGPTQPSLTTSCRKRWAPPSAEAHTMPPSLKASLIGKSPQYLGNLTRSARRSSIIEGNRESHPLDHKRKPAPKGAGFARLGWQMISPTGLPQWKAGCWPGPAWQCPIASESGHA